MDEAGHHGWVYVLRLEDRCWYVGWSADPETRIASHFLGRGAQWTQAHPPIAVESLQPGDTKLENVITIAYMAKYNWKRVRGGQYLEVNMPRAPPPILKAYSLKPAPPPPTEVEAQEMEGHSVVLERVRDEGCQAWRARVSGSRAAKTCPSKGFKTFYGPSEAAVKKVVATWLGGDES